MTSVCPLVPSFENEAAIITHISTVTGSRILRTYIFLYIFNAGVLSSKTVNDIRFSPNTRKPCVINQSISSVPNPRPRYPSFNAMPTAATRLEGGLMKLRLTCPMNSRLSFSSTTVKKSEPLAIACMVLCKNCSVRVGDRCSTKDSRWTTGSLHSPKKSFSSAGV
jgi:hypothetical protein